MTSTTLAAGTLALAIALATSATPTAHAQDSEATVAFKIMTPEVALRLAQGALESCREAGFQVAVAVVDRFGVTQVALRDRYAGPHTVDTATRKAWTSVSFRTSSLDLTAIAGDNPAMSGLKDITNVLLLGGGVPVDAAGSIVGGVGVSGAPSPQADHDCAQAGIDVVADDLAF